MQKHEFKIDQLVIPLFKTLSFKPDQIEKLIEFITVEPTEDEHKRGHRYYLLLTLGTHFTRVKFLIAKSLKLLMLSSLQK
jgi:hypothetical protein